ncbi:MAG: PEP/pyruvate-binding domain-containing protein, partial [Alphaproteobacteria bacterium]|nr:PEP/pyruvate-binding domain-containing protein [Alphaproteobacteria bacterium]
MKNDYLLNLSDMNATVDKFGGGGKFPGLVQIKDFVREFSAKYHVDFRIPKTFALKSYNFFDNTEASPKMNRFEAARLAFKLCGGHVAVRSSANIEDLAGKTFSGSFESVLNVKSETELAAALNKVYLSAYNPDILAEVSIRDIGMGVIIQKMIDSPEMAGVAYSEGFMQQPYIPVSYVRNNTADKLLSGTERGESLIVMKAVPNDRVSAMCELFAPHMINNDEYKVYFLNGKKSATIADKEFQKANQDLFEIAGFANMAEVYLGYPVDVEWVKKGKIKYILQCRPYIMPAFETKQFGPYCMSVYNPAAPIIKGKVLILDDKHDEGKSGIIIMHDFDGVTHIQQKEYK